MKPSQRLSVMQPVLQRRSVSAPRKSSDVSKSPSRKTPEVVSSPLRKAAESSAVVTGNGSNSMTTGTRSPPTPRVVRSSAAALRQTSPGTMNDLFQDRSASSSPQARPSKTGRTKMRRVTLEDENEDTGSEIYEDRRGSKQSKHSIPAIFRNGVVEEGQAQSRNLLSSAPDSDMEGPPPRSQAPPPYGTLLSSAPSSDAEAHLKRREVQQFAAGFTSAPSSDMEDLMKPVRVEQANDIEDTFLRLFESTASSAASLERIPGTLERRVATPSQAHLSSSSSHSLENEFLKSELATSRQACSNLAFDRDQALREVAALRRRLLELEGDQAVRQRRLWNIRSSPPDVSPRTTTTVDQAAAHATLPSDFPRRGRGNEYESQTRFSSVSPRNIQADQDPVHSTTPRTSLSRGRRVEHVPGAVQVHDSHLGAAAHRLRKSLGGREVAPPAASMQDAWGPSWSEHAKPEAYSPVGFVNKPFPQGNVQLLTSRSSPSLQVPGGLWQAP